MRLPWPWAPGAAAGPSLPELMAVHESARASGQRVGPRDYERLMLACLEHGARGAPLFRVMEEAAADGVRYGALTRGARAKLEPLLPPEAEAVGDRAHVGDPAHHNDSAAPAAPLHNDPLPSLWARPSRQVLEFDCRVGSDGLEPCWDAVSSAAEPVLFRGVGAHWPATTSWDLPLLTRSVDRAMVRVAPTPEVRSQRPHHAATHPSPHHAPRAKPSSSASAASRTPT